MFPRHKYKLTRIHSHTATPTHTHTWSWIQDSRSLSPLLSKRRWMQLHKYIHTVQREAKPLSCGTTSVPNKPSCYNFEGESNQEATHSVCQYSEKLFWGNIPSEVTRNFRCSWRRFHRPCSSPILLLNNEAKIASKLQHKNKQIWCTYVHSSHQIHHHYHYQMAVRNQSCNQSLVLARSGLHDHLLHRCSSPATQYNSTWHISFLRGQKTGKHSQYLTTFLRISIT